jgi:DNA repair exonuclease SbcCD ATPase subunit
MKLKALSVEHFRCFSKAEVDLSADVVAIYGRNGIGKTALFDAIELALLGNIGRFSDEASPPDYLSHVFGDQASRVRLTFDGPDGLWMEESWQHGQMGQSAFTTNGSCSGRTNVLYQYVLDPDASPRKELAAAREFFRSVVLLSQETLREFLTRAPTDRERVVSYLVGAGHLQRCLDKAKDVALLAASKKKGIAQARAEVEQRHAAVKSQVLEQQTRLAELLQTIGASAVTFDDVHRGLIALGIQSVDSSREPLPEEAAAFVDATRAACDERRQPQEETLRQLSEVATGLADYRMQAKRHRALLLLRDETNQKIETLLNAENAAFKSITQLRQDRESLSATTRQTRLRVAALEQMPELQARLQAIEANLAELTNTQRRLEEELRAVRSQADASASEFAKAKAVLDSVNQPMDNLRKQVTAAEALKARLPGYLSAVVASSEFRDRIAQANLKVGAVTLQRDQVAARERVHREELADTVDRLSRQKGQQQQRATLLAALRSHVHGPKCPLCGQMHASLQAMLNAIDAQLAEVPAIEASIAQEHEARQRTLLEQQQALKSLDSQLLSIRAEIENNTSALCLQSELINTFRRDVGLAGLQADENAIRQASEERQRAVEAAIIEIRGASEHLQTVQSQCASFEAVAEARSSALADVARRSAEARASREAVIAQAASVGAASFLHTSEEELRSTLAAFTSQLLDNEVKARSLEEVLSKEDAVRSSIRDERARLEASVQEWKGTLVSLGQEVHTFSLKLRTCGLEQDITEDSLVQRQRTAVAARDSLLAVARQVEQYGRHARANALQRYMKELEKQVDELAQERQALLAKERTLKSAEKSADNWALVLGRSLGDCVERRLQEYQGTISSRFRAMIPSPDVFEGLCIQRDSAGVSLGLKYAGVGAVGEPRFFLSSAQANVLALASFLSFAGTQTWSHLDTILMDDPVQHLDDLDAVAFLDMLRTMSLSMPKKQIILSTCDKDLYLLVIRKFLSLQQAGKMSFTGMSLLDDGTSGPSITYDIGGPEKKSLLSQAV